MKIVKTTEIQTDIKPSKSVVVIHDDKVEIYLFADGFNQNNQQVGYMQIQNVFINDKRQKSVTPKS